jgi:hypothetical protein
MSTEASDPVLDHTYTGMAWRGDVYEEIRGSFRVLERSAAYMAVIGNGEDPETIWMVFDDNLENLRRAL